MFIVYTIYSLSIIGFILHIILDKKSKSAFRTVELFLLYQLIFNVGFASILAFIGLFFLPNLVAQVLGWPSCPFQVELANANLAFGVLGILAIWFRGLFWLATIIGISILRIGDGVNHLVEVLVKKNYSAGNTGIFLYTDFLIPLVLIVSILIYYQFRNKNISFK